MLYQRADNFPRDGSHQDISIIHIHCSNNRIYKNNIPLLYSLVNLTYRVAVVIGIPQNIKNVSHSDDWCYCNGVFRHYFTYRQVMQLHQLTNTYHRSCTGGVSKVGVLLFNF